MPGAPHAATRPCWQRTEDGAGGWPWEAAGASLWAVAVVPLAVGSFSGAGVVARLLSLEVGSHGGEAAESGAEEAGACAWVWEVGLQGAAAAGNCEVGAGVCA